MPPSGVFNLVFITYIKRFFFLQLHKWFCEKLHTASHKKYFYIFAAISPFFLKRIEPLSSLFAIDPVVLVKILKFSNCRFYMYHKWAVAQQKDTNKKDFLWSGIWRSRHFCLVHVLLAIDVFEMVIVSLPSKALKRVHRQI